MLKRNSGLLLKAISLLFVSAFFTISTKGQDLEIDIASAKDLYEKGYYENSEKDFRQLLYEFQKNENTNSMEIFICEYYIGNSLLNLNKFNSAEKYLIESLERAKKLFGVTNRLYLVTLLDICNLYNKMGDFKKAESYYLNAISIEQKSDISDRPDYTATLYNLSEIYIRTGKFEDAKKLLLDANEFNISLYGKNSIEYCISIAKLADFYFDIGEIIKAKINYRQALNIILPHQQKDDETYTTIINNYATLLTQIDSIEQAEILFQNNVTQRKNASNKKDYIISLNNLASFYQLVGNYSKSENVLRSTLDMIKQNGLDLSLEYLNTLSLLGNCLSENGDYLQAKNCYLELLNKIDNKYSELYLRTTNNLSVVYFKLSELKNAQSALNNLEEIADSIYSNASPNRIEIYYTLSSYYHKINDLKKEEYYLNKCKEIQKNIYGIDNLDYLNTIEKIAFLKQRNGEKVKSDKIYYEIIESLKTNNSKHSRKYNYLIGNIADYYFQKGNFYKSLEYAIKNVNAINEIVKIEVPISTLNKNEKFATQNKFHFDFLNNILYRIKFNNSLAIQSYNDEILIKNIAIKNFEFIKNTIFNSGDNELINSLYQLLNLRNKLSQIFSMSNNQHSFNINELQLQSDSIERSIITKSLEYKKFNTQLQINWRDIQNKLKKNECSIEFVNFNYYNGAWSDSSLYGALLLRPSYKEPKFVYLFEQKQFDSINIKHQNTSDSSYFNQLYQYGVNGKKLQELIWKPIDSLLEGVETIYAAPSGLLHTINLSALPINNSTRLGDRYNLRIVGSTGELISIKEQYINDSTVNKAWLFGGIDYNNLSVTKPKFDSDNKFNYSISSNPNTRSGTEKWNYLLNTLYEASTIDTMCRKNHINTSFINGKLASKTAFKNISGETKPYILHLATHGYFFPDIKKERENYSSTPLYNKQNIFKISDNPLLRSGLIFSGANKAWSNPNYQSDSTDDGILTALEVSNLDLSEAKLVVMSACETGLGDIKGSEGVFGLQRAFKMAGAKNIIMSLWKVPDEQTKELMKLFYQKCFNGLSVAEALRAAQTEMSKKYPPYYWAAFKLLE